MEPLANLVSLRFASELLGISYDRAHTLVVRRVLPAGVVVRLGKVIRIDKDRLKAWIETGGSGIPRREAVAVEGAQCAE